MWATCRSRAVGPTAARRSASATSWPCAQVSMSRAVAMDAALIGGPNQGSRAPSGSAAERPRPAPRARAASGRAAAPAAFGAPASAAVVDEGAEVGTAVGRPRGRSRLGVGGGEQRLRRRSRRGGRSGGRWSSPRRGSGASHAVVLELGDDAVERVALGPQVGEQRCQLRHGDLLPGRRRCRLLGAEPTEPVTTSPGASGRAGSAAVLLDAALLSTGIDDIPATARDLEARGYAGVWASEVDHDPFLPLLSAGQATDRLQVGTAIAVAFARSPMTLATTAYDLQRYTRGRFVLGPGHADQGARRAAVLHAVEPAGRADARVRRRRCAPSGPPGRTAPRCASRASTTGTR